MTTLKGIAKKGVKFTITHTDGYIANETISHISEIDSDLVVCESGCVYTFKEIKMWRESFEPALNETIGYKLNKSKGSFFSVNQKGSSTGIYSVELLKLNNKPYLGIY